jgi:NAD(P)-dependent dehydrogenase (short-subunit alcohol dehydrogenase family)
MKGKVCVITGANRGIGKATATVLSQSGATVILACRNIERGEIVKADIISVTNNPNVELMQIDLSLQESIQKMVTAFGEKHDRLDVLVNNAAVYKSKRERTPAGLEMMFATNHLGPFLLTNLFLDHLKASSPARVLMVTAPSTTPIDFDNLQGEREFNSLQAFGVTKMCNLLFTYELSRRLAGTGVTVNAVHPGLSKTNLMKEAPNVLRWLTQLASKKPEKAAKSLAYLASSVEMANISGRFFKEGKEIKSNQYSYDQNVQRQLWDVSTALIKPQLGSVSQ